VVIDPPAVRPDAEIASWYRVPLGALRALDEDVSFHLRFCPRDSAGPQSASWVTAVITSVRPPSGREVFLSPNWRVGATTKRVDQVTETGPPLTTLDGSCGPRRACFQFGGRGAVPPWWTDASGRPATSPYHCRRQLQDH